MWVDVLILLETPDADAYQQRVLCAAMERRGWEVHGPGAFKASVLETESDEAVVRLVEQDVNQAVYVAGVTLYDGVCFLSDADVGGHSDPELVLDDDA